jgi:hypothetical protein
MADLKTSDENAAGALTGAELVRVVQGGVSRRTTLAAIAGLATPGGTGSVKLAAAVFVDAAFGNDTTGAVNDYGKPFASIDAALSVLPAGGSVFLSRGRFAPVTDDYAGVMTLDPASKIKTDVSWFGSGMPRKNANNTGLLDGSGTIIEGPLILDSTLHPGNRFHDFGVDSGSTVCSARYGGFGQDGLVYANILHSPTAAPGEGAHFQNVSAICQSAVAPAHGILIENLLRPTGSNLAAWFGTHGVVIKSAGATISGIQSFGHSTECVHIKQDNYATCGSVAVSNIVGGSLNAGDTPVGILMRTTDARALEKVVVSGAVFTDVLYELQFDTQSTGVNRRMRFDGIFGDGSGVRSNTDASADKGSIYVNGHALNELVAVSNPTFANVMLSLHGLGSTGSTTITDSSSYARVAAVSGNAQISTVHALFGEPGILFDGTGDYLTYANDAAWNFGSGDFWIRFWYFPTALTAGGGVLGQWGAALGWLVAHGNPSPAIAATNLRFIASGDGTYSAATFDRYAPDVPLTPNAWNYCDIRRHSGVIGIAVNGVFSNNLVQVGTTASAPSSLTIGTPAQTLNIAGNMDNAGSSSVGVNGSLKELQIIKGESPPLVNYAPPIAPHPNS